MNIGNIKINIKFDWISKTTKMAKSWGDYNSISMSSIYPDHCTQQVLLHEQKNRKTLDTSTYNAMCYDQTQCRIKLISTI